MKQITTPNGYLAVERMGGIDVYIDDCLVCELSGKCMADFSYDEKVNGEKIDDAIDDELDTEKTMEKLKEMRQYC